MQIYVSIGQVSKILGISLSTIYRWEKLGKIKHCFRTIGNNRRYLKSSIDKISNLENNHKKTIAYARVSTHKQKNDLENQKSFLKNYCIEKKINNFEVISDLGSGLNLYISILFVIFWCFNFISSSIFI